MLSINVVTKKVTEAGVTSETTVTFDSVTSALVNTTKVPDALGFNAYVYSDYVTLCLGYEATVRLSKEQLVSVLESLEGDSDYEELRAEAQDED